MPHFSVHRAKLTMICLASAFLGACSPDKQPDITNEVQSQITITLAPSSHEDTIDFTIRNDSNQPLTLKAPVVVRPVNAVFTDNNVGTVPIQILPRQWPDDQINIKILPPVIQNLKPNRVYILTYSSTNPPEPINHEPRQTLAIPVLIGAHQLYEGHVTSELDFAPTPLTTDLCLAMVIRLEKATLSNPAGYIRSNWIRINPSVIGR